MFYMKHRKEKKNERNITDRIIIASGIAINHSNAYTLSFWILKFHVKHRKEIT